MAHYAYLDENNVVVDVITGRDENDLIAGVTNWEDYYSEKSGMPVKRTSYNGNIRKNYAGIGYTYDDQRDAFIPPKPFDSWVLDEDTCRWKAPKPYPEDGLSYEWNEELGDWEAAVFESETPVVK